MPIYKMEGKKDGLQKYRVRINYVDRDGNSKQLDRVAYGKEDAKALERKLNADLKSGELATNKMTVQDLYDEYIKVKAAEVRETTLNTAKKQLVRYVLPYLSDIRIDKLEPRNLQNWKSSIDNYDNNGHKLSVTTKQNVYAAFCAMLNYALKMEYIQRNTLKVVGNFKNVYGIKKEMDFYTPDEFSKFIAVSRDKSVSDKLSILEWHFYMFFVIAFFTGMRKGEIHALKWSDIYDDTIHIRRSIAQKLSGDDRETPPKNKSSIRDIQIPMPLKHELAQHKKRCGQIEGYSEEWRICGGDRCLRDSTLQKRNEAYSKAAGIKTIRIHDFRHSHASLLANNGINIQEIARRLGHSNVQETWNTYSHLYPAESERALSVLDKIII